METIKETITFGFDIRAIKDKVLNHLQHQSKLTNFLYHNAINSGHEEIPNLPTGDLPIVIESQYEKDNPLDVCAEAISWLFKKGIEEIIIGLNESLIEAYKFLEYLRLAETVKKTTYEYRQDIFDQIDEIAKSAARLHIPILLKEIEKMVGQPIPLKKEILSINSVRNCLVHRNGLVSSLDIKPPMSNDLVLTYLHLGGYFLKEEEWKPFTWKDKINNNISSPVQWKIETKEKVYQVNSKIIVDHNLFNSLIFTTITFIDNLYNLLLPNQFSAKANA